MGYGRGFVNGICCAVIPRFMYANEKEEMD